MPLTFFFISSVVSGMTSFRFILSCLLLLMKDSPPKTTEELHASLVFLLIILSLKLAHNYLEFSQ